MFLFINFKNDKYLNNIKNIDNLIKEKNERELINIIINNCYFNNFKIVKYILNNYHIKNINQDINNIFGNIFSNACLTHNFNMIKFLINTRTDIDICYNNYFALKNVCSIGNLEIYKFLITKIKSNEFTEELISLLFTQICFSGNLKFVKYFLQKYPNLNIHFNNEYAFTNACRSGNYNLVKYLLQITPNINININNYEAFKILSNLGNFEIFKLLYEINPNIDITINYNYIIKFSLISGNIKLIKLLINNYNINFLENNCNLFFYVLQSHNYNSIKYILEYQPKIYIIKSKTQLILDFILFNKLNIFKLLQKFILKEDLFKNYNLLFGNACYNGNIESINYLLELFFVGIHGVSGIFKSNNTFLAITNKKSESLFKYLIIIGLTF